MMRVKETVELNPTAASLLGFLQRAPQTGYQLSQQVNQSIGYFWNVTRSQIYRELQSLEKAGLVKEGKAGIRDKRPYSITAEGKQAFAEWLSEEPSVELIRFPLLLSLFFGDSVEPERLKRFLSIHRLRHEQRLDEYRELEKRESTKMTAFERATLDFGMEYEQMVLRWFEKLKLPDKGKRKENI